MDEYAPNNRLEYILYKHCAKIEKEIIEKEIIEKEIIEKENAINIFISKFKFKERHITSFLNMKEFIIEDIVNLKPMYITEGNHVSICIIFNNGNQHYNTRIVQLYVNRGILYKKQITDGTQNIFECDYGIISELGALSGIRYTSILGRAEFIKKIIIYDNNEIITPHKNAKLFDQCTLMVN